MFLQFINDVNSKPVSVSRSRVKYLLRAAKSRGSRVDKARKWRFLADCSAVIFTK